MTQENPVVITLEEGWNNHVLPLAIIPLMQMMDEGFKKGSLFETGTFFQINAMCYNMSTQRQEFNYSEQLYQRHGETITNYLKDTVLPALREKREVSLLLKELVRRWENHKVLNEWLMKVFYYLDRYYVKYHTLPTLKEAGLNCFKSVIYDSIKVDAANGVLDLINEERRGFVIDTGLIQSIVQLYQNMGLGSNTAYETDFEGPLLRVSREFYSTAASNWLASDSSSAYLTRVEKALLDEQQKAQIYYPASESKLLRVLEEELLQKNQKEVIEREDSGLTVMLVNEYLDDLARLYRLFSRLKEAGLQPISDIFRTFIIERGAELVDERVDRIGKLEEKAKEKESGSDPKYIKDLITLHDKFLDLVVQRFNGDPLFHRSLKDAFVEIVNRQQEYHDTASLLCAYSDQVLKGGGTERMEDGEIEAALDKITALFSYLVDKDVFGEVYRNLLAKRLLNQRSVSDDLERVMISKLKQKCGAQYTSKLEGMINDLSIGTDHQSEFLEYSKTRSGNTGLKDFEVQVLTMGNWPTYRPMEVVLPPIMTRCVSLFSEFYAAKTTMRRLQWMYHLGNAEIKGNFKASKIEFQLTTLQAVALLAFSSPTLESLNFTELLQVVGQSVGEENLKRVMHSLCCGAFKIIVKTGNPKAVRTDDVFSFNAKFTSQKRKVRVPLAALEEGSNTKHIEEDRTIAIEACIVRIMKARKTLGHQQLIGEVLTQLAFFRPSPKVIKQKIESLIGREFLERDPDNQTVYKYLA